MSHDNLLPGPAVTLLPDEPAQTVARQLADGRPPAELAARYPAASLPWAVLAEQALTDGSDEVTAYAFARVGYHRSLDRLRRNGWKGHGPVPWSHEPNRGFLRALAALVKAAGRMEETAEEQRCADFLRDSSAEAAAELL